MKFKTRLVVTFVTIILLPLVLTATAFLGIGFYMMNQRQDYGLDKWDYLSLADSMENVHTETEEIFELLRVQEREDATKFEDMTYLRNFEKENLSSQAYLLVRKGEEIYYTGNQKGGQQIIDELPKFGSGEDEEENTYYYGEMEKLVKGIDFYFEDGTPGTLFVITRITNLISKDFLLDMIVAIIVILVFTSGMLTWWIHKGVFLPVKELNLAMCKIKEGNFDYTLSSDSDGEIGELYRNYEDMRLRLKESTEEQIQQEKKNRELISNISHDLKTPITAVKGYVEGIMDGVADTPEKMEKYIKTIYNKANDMDKLINELTVYSGIDNNRIPYNFHRINVADYFGDCVEEVGLDLESRNIELNYSNLVAPDTMIIADPEQMKKVINNIISNSVKYIDKPKGVIDIHILDEVDSVRIEIEDNGKGIAQKDLPLIFERFYRTDASRNSSQGGSGIGLSIVKKIIEDHGGYIWATSKEGEGTCIHFVIRKYKELQQD